MKTLMKRAGLGAALVCGLAWAGVAGATSVTMTFDELQMNGIAGGQYVDQYYNGGCGTAFNGGTVTCDGPNWGVVWSGAAVAKGGPTLTNMPSSPNAIIPSVPLGTSGQDPRMIMNVANGFTSGFSFYYSSRNANAFVTLYSGSDGTGNVLATTNLAKSPQTCNGTAGFFNCWSFVDTLTFSGVAHSVVFGGTFNNVAYDSISFDLNPASTSVPEPAALGMFGLGALLIGLAAGLRRRFN